MGTECVVVEVDTGGASATSLDPEHGTVTVPAPAQQGELTDVRVTATNTFDLTSLDVVKHVRGDLSAEGAAGPFTVSLRCSWRVDGVLQPVAVPGGATRELARHNDFRARYSDLPDSSVCVLAEVDSAGADNVVMVAHLGDDVRRVEADRITLDLGSTSGPGDASVSIVNRFDTDDASGPGSDGSLPNTGSRFGPWLAVIAGLLIASGGALLLTGRTGGWQRSGRT